MEPIIDWESRYQAATTAWEREHLNPAFNEWRAYFETNSGSVIVPGCGRAPEVVEVAAMGWQVTGVDLAETAVGYQRSALKSAGQQGTIEQVNVLAWTPVEPVDLIYEQTCLCALDPQQWQDYAAQLHRWLKPGGVLAALFMQTGREGGPPFHCELSAMRHLFREDLWDWGVQSLESEHPLGVHELGYLITRR